MEFCDNFNNTHPTNFNTYLKVSYVKTTLNTSSLTNVWDTRTSLAQSLIPDKLSVPYIILLFFICCSVSYSIFSRSYCVSLVVCACFTHSFAFYYFLSLFFVFVLRVFFLLLLYSYFFFFFFISFALIFT